MGRGENLSKGFSFDTDRSDQGTKEQKNEGDGNYRSSKGATGRRR